jgi:rhodanese-related sulfurtransferase
VSRPTRRFHIPSALRPSSLRIEAEQARELVAGGATLIDVRRQDDPAAALAGSERVSPDRIPGRTTSFPRDVPVVLACT